MTGTAVPGIRPSGGQGAPAAYALPKIKHRAEDFGTMPAVIGRDPVTGDLPAGPNRPSLSARHPSRSGSRISRAIVAPPRASTPSAACRRTSSGLF